MNANALKVLNSKPAMIAAGVAVAALAVYFIGKATIKGVGNAAGAAADAVGNINEGTPYEGFGILGTIANGIDALSGRALSTVGEHPERGSFSLGSWLYDVFNPYDPNQ
jgi:hypothetical protein